MKDRLSVAGRFGWRHWSRERKSGTRLLVHAGEFPNGITYAGLGDFLNAGFGGGTQRSWYAGLVDLSGFTAFAAADTMASHAGWLENTAYSASTRPQWSPGAAAGTPPAVVNGTFFGFTFTASATVHGFFIATSNTKGGTSGVMWAAGAGDADQQMSTGEFLDGRYTLTGTAGAGS